MAATLATPGTGTPKAPNTVPPPDTDQRSRRPEPMTGTVGPMGNSQDLCRVIEKVIADGSRPMLTKLTSHTAYARVPVLP
jgi:hypothetical protein